MQSCITPLYKRNVHTRELDVVPCGICPGCIGRKASSWAFRLMQEDRRSLSSHFITLTYDTKYIPITEDGLMELSIHDLQCYFKRLRHMAPVRYYACGEYGDNTDRPHYHAIVFNCTPQEIEKAWGKEGKAIGGVHIGEVTVESIRYTLKYMQKIRKRDLADQCRQPEFAIMSKGIGKGYLTEQMKSWHHQSLQGHAYCMLPGGIKIPMPRYYADKLYSREQKQAIAAHMRSIEKPDINEADQVQAHLAAFRKLDSKRLNSLL